MQHAHNSSLWQDAWERLRDNRLALIGLYYLIGITGLTILAPYFSPYAYDAQNLDLGASAPSLQHWFGTDTLGRDLFTRAMYGGRISLLVGVVASVVALCIGLSWGLIAGFVGGWVDTFMMRIVDMLYALPFMILIILLTVVFGRNIVLLFLAIGCVEWLTMARIVRAEVRSCVSQPYIEAAHCLGLSRARIITRHIMPNILGPVIIYATLTIPSVMMLESFLSFLGLGIQPPSSSWGLLLSNGAQHMEEYPWLLLFPGALFSATLFALNFLGDGLRDAIDPMSAEH
jgi:oligopeptide transport system permease protein